MIIDWMLIEVTKRETNKCCKPLGDVFFSSTLTKKSNPKLDQPLDLSACLWKIQETTNYVRGQCGDIVSTIQTVEDSRTNDSVSLTKKLEAEREREVEDQEDEKEDGKETRGGTEWRRE